MAGIELEIGVRDKASAEINAVSRRAMTAFDQIRSYALRAGTAITGIFRSAISHVTSFVSQLFSVRSLLLMLVGYGGISGGIMLMSRAFEALAARSAPLAARFQAIGQAISGFFGRIIDYIGNNPTLLRALDHLAWWITDMTARLPDMEKTIQNIITWLVDFVQTTVPKLWSYLQQFIQWVKDAYQWASNLVKAASSWLNKPAQGATNPSAASAAAVTGTMHGGSEDYSTQDNPNPFAGGWNVTGYGGSSNPGVNGGTSNIGGPNTTINNTFYGQYSRSDIANVVKEIERNYFRDGGGGGVASGGYDDSGESEE